MSQLFWSRKWAKIFAITAVFTETLSLHGSVDLFLMYKII